MKKLTLLSIFIGLTFIVNAQSRTGTSKISQQKLTSVKASNTGFDKSKLTFGGGFGFGFGSDDYWSIYLSPQVGYNFTDKLSAGTGLSYSYSSEKYSGWSYNGIDSNWKYSKNYLGFNLYGNYYPVSYIIFTIKPEILRMWETTKITERNNNSRGEEKYKNSEFIPAVVVGAGIRLKPMIFTLNYDLVQDENTPYGDNIYFSVGFMF